MEKVDSIEYAVDQITDEFMIYGLKVELLDKLSKSFSNSVDIYRKLR